MMKEVRLQMNYLYDQNDDLYINLFSGIPHHSRNDVGGPFQTAVDGAKQGFPYNPLTQTIKQKPSYNRGSKIVGGQDVEPGQYPFQVLSNIIVLILSI